MSTPIVERLVESCRLTETSIATCTGAIAAYDLLEHNVEIARKATASLLEARGVDDQVASNLAAGWINHADFLLTEIDPESADYVVGNPPYVRLEAVDDAVREAYRQRWSTMKGRADIYIGFYEHGLKLLAPRGALAFVCADRWMRNQYGAGLRQLVGESYAVEAVVSMHDVDAFEADVAAYPAVTVIRRGHQQSVSVIDTTSGFGAVDATDAVAFVQSGATPKSQDFAAQRLSTWFDGGSLWPTGSSQELQLICDIERRFPPLQLEATGTKVGVGVATGCDQVYLRADFGDLIESERRLPIVTPSDIRSGTIEWGGLELANPWSDEGLVDLKDWPGLHAYLVSHEKRLRARHVAKRSAGRWYRTIDRVHPTLAGRPKLLLPDMKSKAHPVLDVGGLYPSHNIYYVISDSWDLEVLGGLLLSDITNLFIGAYCVRMRGGTYRFQAQYLRKLRVPDPDSIDSRSASRLRQAFADRDVDSATAIAERLYGVDLPASSAPNQNGR